MATTTSNTFSTPSATQTMAASRSLYNNSIRAVLENFTSANVVPTSTNVKHDETASTPQEGMLWYNNATGGLYLNIGNFYSWSGATAPFGNFRRMGIGVRQEYNLAHAQANIGRMEAGELIVTVNGTAGASNNRLYMISETGGVKSFVDVGTPTPTSVTMDTIADDAAAIIWAAFMGT